MSARLSLLLAVGSVVSACGGGGGDSGTPPADALSKYAGTYTFCEGHERITMTATVAGTNQLSLVQRSDYYRELSCSGPVVATETPVALSVAWLSSGPSTVAGYPIPSGTTPATVDRIAINAPASTTTLTGSGVTTLNGKPCVVYANGQVCFDSLQRPAVAGTGGLAFTGSALLLLSATATAYELDTAYPRP